MNNVANAIAVLFLAVLVATGILDIIRHPKAREATEHLQVPVSSLPLLGAVKVLLAVGVVAGFGQVRIAELTGLCLCGYFAVATMTHLRVRDGARATAPAFVLLVLAGLYLLATIAM